MLKKDEFETILKDIVDNANDQGKLTASLQQLREDHESGLDELEKTSSDLQTANESIVSLKQQNLDLFFRTSSDTGSEPDPEPEPEEVKPVDYATLDI